MSTSYILSARRTASLLLALTSGFLLCAATLSNEEPAAPGAETLPPGDTALPATATPAPPVATPTEISLTPAGSATLPPADLTPYPSEATASPTLPGETATGTLESTGTTTPVDTVTVTPPLETIAPTTTDTLAATSTATASPTSTSTVLPPTTGSPTSTPTVLPTTTVSPTSTSTVLPTVSPTPTPTVWATATASPSSTSTVLATATVSSTPTLFQEDVSGVASTSLVINQIYGGGGNGGAPYSHDFIELYNLSGGAVDISGWSVQYAPATGGTWVVTTLTGSVPPGGYYLVQQGSGGTNGAALPVPDAVGTTNLSATGGKVALLTNAAPLNGVCPAGIDFVDFVGYGSANCYEGAPAGSLSNTTAALRIGADTATTTPPISASARPIRATAPTRRARPPRRLWFRLRPLRLLPLPQRLRLHPPAHCFRRRRAMW